MQSQLRIRLALINAFLNRPADALLPVPSELPPARTLAYDDSQLIDLAAKQNPELIELADELKERHQGIRLAELQYVPDFNFSAGTDLEGITRDHVAEKPDATQSELRAVREMIQSVGAQLMYLPP